MFGLFKKKKVDPSKSEKEIATEKGEIYFKVLQFDFEPENPSEGSFELDWNIFAVQKLREMGYPGQSDEDVIDNYFTYVCRNIALQQYENEMGDPSNRLPKRVDLGDGRAEYK